MTVTGSRLARPEEEVRGLVTRLMTEEDILRRDQMEMTNNLGDKVSYFISESQQQPLPAMYLKLINQEMMILLQQRKIAALDEANNRLLAELSRLGDRVGHSRAAPPKRSLILFYNTNNYSYFVGQFRRPPRRLMNCWTPWIVSVTQESDKIGYLTLPWY